MLLTVTEGYSTEDEEIPVRGGQGTAAVSLHNSEHLLDPFKYLVHSLF